MRYVIIQTVLLLGLLIVIWLNPGSRLLPEHPLLRAGGWMLCIAAMLLVAMAFRSLGTAFQAAPAPRDEASLVVGGIYRTLRHPMYTAVVGVVTGLFLLRPTWPMGVSAGALIVFYLIKARHEEGLLAQRYPEYEAYRQRSRGVIPFR